VDDGESVRAVRHALARGVRFFDTADCYGLGHSETILSTALGRDRHDVLVATKFGVRWDGSGRTRRDASPSYLRQALDGSLRRLRLERVPLYYVHWPDPAVPLEETLGALVECQREGKIGAIGLSNFSAPELRRAVAVAPVDAVQVQFSLLDGTPLADVVPFCRQRNIPVVAWGALSQGLLTGKFDERTTFGPDDRRSRYPAFQGERYRRNLALVSELKRLAARRGIEPGALALRWVLSAPGLSCALFGAKTPRQVDSNIEALGAELAAEDREAIDRLAERCSAEATEEDEERYAHLDRPADRAHSA
jgi:aryl-alcohol dehydrogenase-like predicted oxidoreductase